MSEMQAVEQPSKDQLIKNIDAYAAVYRRCLEKAEELVGKKKLDCCKDDQERWQMRIDCIASEMFQRFWNDQMAINKPDSIGKLANMAQEVLSRRLGI